MARIISADIQAARKGRGEWYAGAFMMNRPPFDRDWVMKELHNLTFMDAFDDVCAVLRNNLAGDVLADFEARAKVVFTPRDEKVYHELLRTKLAVDPDGEHIPGVIGSTVVGSRPMGSKIIEVETPHSLRRRKMGGADTPRETHHVVGKHLWPIYAGEEEERKADSGVADAFPDPASTMVMMATNPGIANTSAIAALNAIVDALDEGTGAAVIKGRSGAQPADVDTTATGTVLHSNPMSATAFGNATDGTGKATATAAAITDDTSADASGTVGYDRASSSNDGATPLDDKIDGSAGTASADFIYNTTSIVAGATVSITSFVVNLPET